MTVSDPDVQTGRLRLAIGGDVDLASRAAVRDALVQGLGDPRGPAPRRVEM